MSILTPVIMSGILPNFVPVVDGLMVPIHPRDSIASGASKNHDLMTGFTHHDGAGIVYLNPLGRATKWNKSKCILLQIEPIQKSQENLGITVNPSNLLIT